MGKCPSVYILHPYHTRGFDSQSIVEIIAAGNSAGSGQDAKYPRYGSLSTVRSLINYRGKETDCWTDASNQRTHHFKYCQSVDFSLLKLADFYTLMDIRELLMGFFRYWSTYHYVQFYCRYELFKFTQKPQDFTIHCTYLIILINSTVNIKKNQKTGYKLKSHICGHKIFI